MSLFIISLVVALFALVVLSIGAVKKKGDESPIIIEGDKAHNTAFVEDVEITPIPNRTPKSLELKILDVVRKYIGNLDNFTLVYIGSGIDVAGPVLSTGARNLVFIDPEANPENIISDESRGIKSIGGEVTEHILGIDVPSTITFRYGAKEHKIETHQKAVDQVELPEHEIHYEHRSQQAVTPTHLQKLKVGGLYIGDTSSIPQDREILSVYGLEDVTHEIGDIDKSFGYGELRILRKSEQTNLEGIHNVYAGLQEFFVAAKEEKVYLVGNRPREYLKVIKTDLEQLPVPKQEGLLQHFDKKLFSLGATPLVEAYKNILRRKAQS